MSNFFKRSQKMKPPNTPDRGDNGGKIPDTSSGFFKRKSSAPVEPSVKSEKKPFDKKLYRLKKYSNKYKLQQWETKRKEKVSREYSKQTKDDPKIDVQKIYEQDSDNDMDNDNNVNTDIQQNIPSSSGGTIENKKYKKAYLQFADKQEQNRQRKELLEKQKAEKKVALEEYKRKKVEKFKKLNKKTKRGQPVMKGRMEILLEEIQNSIKN